MHLTELFGEILFQSPKTEGGIADVEDFLAVDGIEAVFQGVGIVFCGHFREIAEAESDGFDFLTRDTFAGAISDGEAAFA